MANNHSNHTNKKLTAKSINGQAREIDTFIHNSLAKIQRNWILISRRKIATWQGLLIIVFISGFFSALIWAGYQRLYTGILAEQTDDNITNIAQVTYQDAELINNYGPTPSNTLTISKDKGKPAETVKKLTIEFPKDFYDLNVKIVVTDQTTNSLITDVKAKVKNKKIDITFNPEIPKASYYIMLVPPDHLSKKLNIDLNSAENNFIVIDSDLRSGNLYDADDIINAVDWEQMSQRWGTGDPIADLNLDGLVNTLDWSRMNQYWGVKGDCPEAQVDACRNRD